MNGDDAAVAIVGAGPVGLMTACELALAGVRPLVLEREPQPRTLPKANGLVGQIVTMLDYRGLLERFSAGSRFGGPINSYRFGGLDLDFSSLESSPLSVLLIQQPRLEALLAERAGELGVEVRRGHAVERIRPDAGGVTLDVAGAAGGGRLRARYLVGCDGIGSGVREQAGIAFPGTTYPGLTRLGHVRMPASVSVRENGDFELPGGRRIRPGFTRTERGLAGIASFTPGVLIVSATETDPSAGDLHAPMALDELAQAVARVLGTEVPLGEPIWLSRTRGQARLAEAYRAGRVFIAGDAAHAFPAGGSALNAGLMDAVNLGWKLAAEVHGWAPPGLLDTYDRERRLAGRRTLLQTRAQHALGSEEGEDGIALRELLGEIVRYPEPARHLGEMLAGTDTPYDMGGPPSQAHPLLGRFVPDLPLRTPSGATRVAERLRTGRAVLLHPAAETRLREAAAPWTGRVEVVTADVVAGAPPAALLIRPDGYVAWASAAIEPDAVTGLTRALRQWFGDPGKRA